MPTEAKSAVIDEMQEKLERARGAVLLTTQGLTVAEVTELRRKLRAAGLELHVIKNTLLRIASERAHYQDLSELLHGQTAIALSYDDEIAAAKAITDYLRTARTGKPVTIKAGILEITNATSWTLYDEGKTKVLINSLAPRERRGLPVGRYVLTMMKQDQNIEIKDGETVTY